MSASAELQQSALEGMVEAGIDGGAVYDGYIGLIATEYGETLLTRDTRAVRSYLRLGVNYELVA